MNHAWLRRCYVSGIALLQVLTPVQIEALGMQLDGAEPAVEPKKKEPEQDMKAVIKAALLKAIERKKNIGKFPRKTQ